MAKTRLNQYMRESLIQGLIRHALSKQDAELSTRETALAERAIRDIIGPKGMKALNMVPDEWLPLMDAINVNAAGWKVYLRLFGPSKEPEAQQYYQQPFGYVRVSRRLPVFFNRSLDAPAVQDPALAAEIQAFSQGLEKIQEERRAIRAEIKALVNAYRYAEDVRKAIPEIDAIAPGALALAPPTAIVPAAEVLFCKIAKLRGEERDGCCDGELKEAA